MPKYCNSGGVCPAWTGTLYIWWTQTTCQTSRRTYTFQQGTSYYETFLLLGKQNPSAWIKEKTDLSILAQQSLHWKFRKSRMISRVRYQAHFVILTVGGLGLWRMTGSLRKYKCRKWAVKRQWIHINSSWGTRPGRHLKFCDGLRGSQKTLRGFCSQLRRFLVFCLRKQFLKSLHNLQFRTTKVVVKSFYTSNDIGKCIKMKYSLNFKSKMKN